MKIEFRQDIDLPDWMPVLDILETTNRILFWINCVGPELIRDPSVREATALDGAIRDAKRLRRLLEKSRRRLREQRRHARYLSGEKVPEPSGTQVPAVASADQDSIELKI